MRRTIWFGNRRRMQWVKAWKEAPEYSFLGAGSDSVYLGGGAGSQWSIDGHGEYNLEWNVANVDTLRPIMDYALGQHGKERIYWSDPMWARRNALSPAWSMPWTATEDAMPLIERARPVKVTNPDTSFDYPAVGAQYTVFNTDATTSILIPIPPQHTAWVGVHGDGAAADMVKVTPYEGMSTSGPIVRPAVLGVNTNQLVNTPFVGGDQGWIELSLDVSAVPPGESHTFILYGLVVQVLPPGVQPKRGRFLPGRGHTGCSFRGFPLELPQNAAHDTMRVVARLLEVGAWE